MIKEITRKNNNQKLQTIIKNQNIILNLCKILRVQINKRCYQYIINYV